MSMHKIPLTQIEEDGLRAHGLDIGTPSQLSDVFRKGIACGQNAETIRSLQAENERLRKGLEAVESLIGESSGVAGLHMNGDVAPWGDLRTGGKYEGWLVDFDAAMQGQKK